MSGVDPILFCENLILFNIFSMCVNFVTVFKNLIINASDLHITLRNKGSMVFDLIVKQSRKTRNSNNKKNKKHMRRSYCLELLTYQAYFGGSNVI